jgi:threonine dehydratase
VVAILIPDRPGQLAEIVAVIARQRANVLAVTHYREGRNIGVLQTEAELTLETRDEGHSQAVVDALGDAGFQVRRLR